DWAMTQNNLGTALTRLGERESGTARLEEAVQAYRAALQEYTQERVPLAWAMTQHNLGAALTRLGERESGTARLEEAVQAYRAALQERTQQRVPLDWAMTQNNLGTALTRLGERESGRARLEEAVQAYRAALQERTQQRGKRSPCGVLHRGLAIRTMPSSVTHEERQGWKQAGKSSGGGGW
ncbi:tetratricopeptide repeat protein, partial [Azohydromonas aeria]|uniref:tetratricopeptide repeat protein n=1 Tax=Azohydromonas aeria TaxID=2590212 RepID=UPI0012FCABE4